MSEDIEEVEIYMPTKRQLMATAFRENFDTEFAEAMKMDAELFTMKTSVFDNFVIKEGFCSYSKLPTKGTPEWVQFRHESNTARYELNSASEIGLHGEPPFRIDNERGILRVRMLAGIVKVTHTMIAKQIKSLLKNKDKQFTHMWDYLEDNKEALSPYVQGLMGQQEQMFAMTISNATHALSLYINNVEKTYAKAKDAIDAKALEHKPEESPEDFLK